MEETNTFESPDNNDSIGCIRDDKADGGRAKEAKKPVQIKVFALESAKTESERRSDYERWKAASAEPGWMWDTWRKLESARSPFIQPSNIMSIQVKNLLGHTVPLSEGNPHTVEGKETERDVWLQVDRDLKIMDLSFREYRMPRDEKFKVAGLQLWWRRNGGAAPPGSRLFRNMTDLAPDSEIDRAGETSLMRRGAFAGSLLTPLPFPAESRIMLAGIKPEQLTPLIYEVNRVTAWFLKNESLLWQQTDDGRSKFVRPAVITWPEVVPTKDRVATKLQPHVGVLFTENGIAADMRQVDLLDTWHQLRLLPVTSPRLAEIVNVLAARWQAWQQMRAHRFASQTLTLEKTYQNLLAAELRPAKNGRPAARWRDLTATERTHVQKQLEQRRVRKENPELRKTIGRIHRAFNAAITDNSEMRRVMDDLRRTSNIARAKPDEYIELFTDAKAGKTGVRVLLCPHYGFLVRETIAAKKNVLGQIDTQALTQACVQRFASSTPVNFRYYCSRCGELLMVEELDEFVSFTSGNTIASSTQDKDPIWAYILSECNQVVRRIRFAKPQNVRPLVLAIAQTLESEMLTQQSELQKSKTKSLEDIRSIMTVIISTYCYALVSKMIIDHPQRLRWNVVEAAKTASGGKVQRQAEAAKVLSLAYNMIVDSNQNRISKIKDFGVDQIKPILLRAYEWARNAKFVTQETEDERASDWSTAMINDPWYNLIYEMAASHGDVGYTDFSKLLGNRDPLVALCAERPFEHAFRPKKSGKTDFSPREENYIALLDYVDSGAYREFAVPRSPLLIAWWKKWEHLLVTDPYPAQMHALRPSRKLNRFLGQVPTFEHLDISLIRCPTGELHQFTELVFQQGAKRTKVSASDVKKTGRIPPGTLHDELCSHCGMSKYAKANPRVREQISKEIDRQNFFKQFENRCPAPDRQTGDNLHDFPQDKLGFTGDAPCRKCGFQHSFVQSRPQAYFTKWSKSFIQRERRVMPLEPERRMWAPPQIQGDKWNVTLASVMQIANLSGIPYNVWVNLGMSEHKNFQLIKQGKINPQSTMDDREAAARLVKLVNWVRWVHKQYMLVRNHSRAVLPLGLKTVLEAEPHAMAAHETLVKSMGPILRDFNSRLERYTGAQGARVACNYALHTLCATLLQIRSIAAIKKLAHNLFDYMVAQIVQGESMMSALEIAKMQTAATSEREDAPAIDDDDYLEAGEQQDVLDRGSEDPFSMEGADIENANTGGDNDEDYADYS
jgi:hypothetical protein